MKVELKEAVKEGKTQLGKCILTGEGAPDTSGVTIPFGNLMKGDADSTQKIVYTY